MTGYVSSSSHGIDAKAFFNDFNTDITTVSRATGISRPAVTRMVALRSETENTEKIVEYLEEINKQDYDYVINECIDEIRKVFNKVKNAWADYERKEKILEQYRCKYRIKRKQPMAARRKVKEILQIALKA